ncbi:MAG: sigma-70 family RNA polymerase sigma factor [Brevinematales bacterium]|nr:sigma-70 family RNA polymerase sigma factor [Brevinematales bacterium]
MITDEDIIKEFLSKQGNAKKEAFTLLYNKYHNLVYDFGRTMGIDRENCEDFVQEVFLKVIKRIGSFDIRKKFFPWFYSIVRNTAYDFLKKHKYQNENYRITSYTKNPYEFEIELINQVRDIVLRLPDREREVIFLRFYQNLSPEEISTTFGCSTRTVYNIIQKALDIIKKHWK